MITFLHDVAKPLAEISKMHLPPVWLTKIILRLLATTNLSTTANQLTATFCSNSAKPARRQQTKWYGKLCRSVVRGADKVWTESFFVTVQFLIHSQQYANTWMAVLIRRVTCKSLFSFWGQRKVLSSEIYLRGLRPCVLHEVRSSFSELRPSQQPF